MPVSFCINIVFSVFSDVSQKWGVNKQRKKAMKFKKFQKKKWM